MTTKHELEDAIRARIKPGMDREAVKEIVAGVLESTLPVPTVEVVDGTTPDDIAAGRMRATVRVGNVPHDVAARMLAEVPGTTVHVAGSLELTRHEDGGHGCVRCGHELERGDLVIRGNHRGLAGEQSFAHADCFMAAQRAGDLEDAMAAKVAETMGAGERELMLAIAGGVEPGGKDGLAAAMLMQRGLLMRVVGPGEVSLFTVRGLAVLAQIRKAG